MNKTIIALLRINKFAYLDICFGDIGITHVFFMHLHLLGPRKVFEHKADRPSAKTSPEGPC